MQVLRRNNDCYVAVYLVWIYPALLIFVFSVWITAGVALYTYMTGGSVIGVTKFIGIGLFLLSAYSSYILVGFRALVNHMLFLWVVVATRFVLKNIVLEDQTGHQDDDEDGYH